jgi:hypothetical protein
LINFGLADEPAQADYSSGMVDLKATEMPATERWVSIKEKLPPRNRPVLYRTELYLSAGHLSSDGVWRYSAQSKELLPVLCWSFLA